MTTSTAEATSGQLDSPKDLKNDETSPAKQEALRWIGEIQSAEKVFGGYHKRVDDIYERFRDDRGGEEREGVKQGDNQTRRYNALWSMKQTLKPLLYAAAPNPYVSRKFDDSAPVARDASLLLQRLLTGVASTDEFFDAGSEASDEYILAGRGVMWTTYLPEFGVRESEVPTDLAEGEEPPLDEFSEEDKEPYAVQTREDGSRFFFEKFEQKISEKLVIDCVNFKDFLHGPSTKWRNVPWVARRVPMLRSELIKRFGAKKGNAVPLSSYETGDKRTKAGNTDDFKGHFRRGIVWEIWDRVNGEIIWLCTEYPNEILDKKKDPLKLQGFFPCPKPMFGTMTTDSMIPIPDYTEWQDIALELDEVTYRIALLTDALRVVGVYDETAGPELKKVVEGRQNTMIAVSNWAQFAEGGGLKGAVQFLSLEEIRATLESLYRTRAQLVQEMYEITGIADIVRGASDPRETASAQKLKGNFANSRLTERQKVVARHVREMLNIVAEIMCTLYSDDNLKALSGAELVLTNAQGQFDEPRWAAALQLLRNEPLLRLQVKIDTETLADEQISADREEATQFITALSSLLQNAVAVSQSAPAVMPVIGKLIMLTVRKFKAGRSVEADIEQAVNTMANTPPQQEGEEAPAGESGMNQLEHDIESKRLQLEQQELELKQRELAVKERKVQLEEQSVGIDWYKVQHEVRARNRDLDIKQSKATSDAQLKHKQIDTQAQGQQRQIEANMAIEQRYSEQQERSQAHDQIMREREHVAGQHQAAQSREDQLARGERDDEHREADRQAKLQAERARRSAVPA